MVIEYQLYFAKDLLNINKKRWFLLVYRVMKKKERSTFLFFDLCSFPNPFVYEVRDPVQSQMHVLEGIALESIQ